MSDIFYIFASNFQLESAAKVRRKIGLTNYKYKTVCYNTNFKS